jgi:hypothetical protein
MDLDEIVFVEYPPSMTVLSSFRALPRPDSEMIGNETLNPYHQRNRPTVETSSAPDEKVLPERDLSRMRTQTDMEERVVESGLSRQRQSLNRSPGSEPQSDGPAKHEGKSLGMSDVGHGPPFPGSPPHFIERHSGQGKWNTPMSHPVSPQLC